MITMKGKYNCANVFVDELDEVTKEQIQTFLNHPAFGHGYIAIMPDCHAGSGAVIGFTMPMNQYVIPNVVGVDIGCGVLAANIGPVEVDFTALDKFIHNEIPYGFRIHQKASGGIKYPLVLDLADICNVIGYDFDRAWRSLGTLGGGNHFIEVDRDQKGNAWLLVHSGSRNFGLSVANYYQKKAKEGLEVYFIGDEYKHLEFIPLQTTVGQDYLRAMGVAQAFAKENRQRMMDKLVTFILDKDTTHAYFTVESVHNYIDLDNQMVRKGAISARLDEGCVIPLNMRDGAIVGIGKGSAKFNFSAPHGAGRTMSRKKAKETLSLETFKIEMAMAGVFTTTANKDTLDEAPEAYKSADMILKAIEETVEITDRLKPVYNFKAAE